MSLKGLITEAQQANHSSSIARLLPQLTVAHLRYCGNEVEMLG
jgi:hypothetical protein